MVVKFIPDLEAQMMLREIACSKLKRPSEISLNNDPERSLGIALYADLWGLSEEPFIVTTRKYAREVGEALAIGSAPLDLRAVATNSSQAPGDLTKSDAPRAIVEPGGSDGRGGKELKDRREGAEARTEGRKE